MTEATATVFGFDEHKASAESSRTRRSVWWGLINV